MPDASLLALATLAASLIILAVLLLRRPPEPPRDPALPLLLAAQERQGERLGALSGELREAIALAREDTGRTISGFATEQSRLLSEALAAQRARLDAMEKALLERLADHRAAEAEGAALLRRDLGAGLADHRNAQTEAEARLRKALADDMTAARDLIDRKAAESRAEIEARLKEMREANDARLADIQKSVNEQLHSAVEKQMAESFNRVIDQFAAVQKAMGDVAAVTGQIGDLKRLFSNVKTRGGWGETQVKAVLDDFLPAGTYETNARVKEDSNDTVEFAILMPTPGEGRVRLPVDAKFPVEDYERLLFAHDAGDPEGEAQARRGLELRIRAEAQKIAQKYIAPPATTEFAVMYLPTEGLYAEVARIPGLIDDVGRQHRVFVCGPSLLPAMLRTIQLGHVTLALSRNAESVRELLAATKAEMAKMDGVLERLGKNVGTMSNTIGDARIRTRAIARRLKAVEALPIEQSGVLLGLDQAALPEEEAEE